MKLDKENSIFFLGGSDLEMSEIKNILEQEGCVYVDKGLTWNTAYWEQYAIEIADAEKMGKQIVGIELFETTDFPKKDSWLLIDHHNDLPPDPSSIEQIARLLDIELTREQKLIAENDKGFIPALIKAGATDEEIKEIRLGDRKAQGVTKEDEEKAAESIKTAWKIGNVTIVFTESKTFSPITDSRYGLDKHLIIYNDYSQNYYGKGKVLLVEKFADLVQKGQAYHGGGNAGFFGFIDNHLTREEFETEILPEIIKTVDSEKLEQKLESEVYISNSSLTKTNAEDNLFSTHIFLFPFRWDIKPEQQDKTFKEKSELKEIINFMEEPDTKWLRNNFKIDSRYHYNEYNYFYDFVRDILYDKGEDRFIANYQYNIPPDIFKYTIEIKDSNLGVKVYNLLIDSITLNWYDTGVGVLSFHLNNRDEKQSSESDILKINQYGRRIYPPFLGIEKNRAGKQMQYSKDGFQHGLALVQDAEMPISIEIEGVGKENFVHYTNSDLVNEMPFFLPRFIQNLFLNIPLVGVGRISTSTKYVEIESVLDDRMFVICWYGNDKLSTYLTEERYLADPWWYQFIFVDGGVKSCQSKKMTVEFLEKSTYTRWIDYHTLFGVSRYSFVCLTTSQSSLGNASYLITHMQSMYYKICELSLAQRACVLKFSDEVARVSAMDDNSLTELSGKVTSLYKQYIRFVNKIYFREVTAQEQGIELYDILHNKLRLKEQIKDLEQEIEELHSYVGMLEDGERNKDLATLTTVSSLFLIPTFIAGFFGMNNFEFEKPQFSGFKPVVFLISIALISILTLWLLQTKYIKKEYTKMLLVWGIVIAFFIALIIIFKG